MHPLRPIESIDLDLVKHWNRILQGELFASSSRVDRAILLQRRFGFDALKCPQRAAKLSVLATIIELSEVKKILSHLGMRTEPLSRGRARDPTGQESYDVEAASSGRRGGRAFRVREAEVRLRAEVLSRPPLLRGAASPRTALARPPRPPWRARRRSDVLSARRPPLRDRVLTLSDVHAVDQFFGPRGRRVVDDRGMRREFAGLVVTTILVGACSHQASTSGAPPTSSVATSINRSSSDPMLPLNAAPAASTTSKPTSDFPIESFDLGGGALAVMNLAKHHVRLASSVAVERRQSDGAWKAVEGMDRDLGYRLVETCGPAPADGCVELEGGKALFPAPWSGLQCAAQCNKACKDDGPVGPGEFRFVVAKCGASEVALPGPAFTLPRQTQAQLARWRLVQGLTKAIAVRLSQPPKLDMSKEPIEGRVLGFTRQGSAHDVARDVLDALRVALTREDGFEDAVVNRCAMQQLVGLQLTHTVPASIYGELEAPSGEAVTDVVLDLHCQRIFSRTRELTTRFGARPATKASVDATNFGPSRSTFVALAKALLPHDPEIGTLR